MSHLDAISEKIPPSNMWYHVILCFQISKILYSDSSSESVDENRDPDEEIFKKPR